MESPAHHGHPSPELVSWCSPDSSQRSALHHLRFGAPQAMLVTSLSPHHSFSPTELLGRQKESPHFLHSSPFPCGPSLRNPDFPLSFSTHKLKALLHTESRHGSELVPIVGGQGSAPWTAAGSACHSLPGFAWWVHLFQGPLTAKPGPA